MLSRVNYMDRRHLLLNEMGISQWQLHRPEVLHGVVTVVVAPHIRLIVVAEEDFSQSALFADILRALALRKEDCLCVNDEQVQHLELNHSARYWLLAEEAKQHRIEAYCLKAEQIYRSPDFAQFQSSPADKRELWRQIQQTQ